MANLKVSVIIPVYNQEELVIRAIDSVPKRDDIEIIVINDCSTDRTWSSLVRYKQKNSGIKLRLMRNRRNNGVAWTVNKGYDQARGEYIVLLGSDDYFYTDEFLKAMQYLDGSDLIYFNLQINDGTIFQITPYNKTEYCGSVKFMRREFIGETRNPVMKAREDWYFYQDLLLKDPRERYTDLTVKHYNFPREGSLTWEACNGFKG